MLRGGVENKLIVWGTRFRVGAIGTSSARFLDLEGRWSKLHGWAAEIWGNNFVLPPQRREDISSL